MTRSWIFAVVCLVAAREARADGLCNFPGEGFDMSADFSGACVEASQVPIGCPIDIEVADATVLAAGTPVAMLSGSGSAVLTLHGSADVTTSAVDVPDSDCNCDPVVGSLTVDQFSVTVTGAQEGDEVVFTAGTLDAEQAFVVFVGSGACPAESWPTSYSFVSECDRCPMPGSDGDGSDGDGSDGGSDERPATSACDAGGGGLGAPLGLLLGLGLLRRRHPASAR